MERHVRWAQSRKLHAGVVPPQRGLKGKDFSPSETLIVSRFYGQISKKRILSLLPGRDWDSVTAKARRLGVDRQSIKGMLTPSRAARVIGYSRGAFDRIIAGIEFVSQPNHLCGRKTIRWAPPEAYARAYATSEAAGSDVAYERVYRLALASLKQMANR